MLRYLLAIAFVPLTGWAQANFLTDVRSLNISGVLVPNAGPAVQQYGPSSAVPPSQFAPFSALLFGGSAEQRTQAFATQTSYMTGSDIHAESFISGANGSPGGGIIPITKVSSLFEVSFALYSLTAFHLSATQDSGYLGGPPGFTFKGPNGAVPVVHGGPGPYLLGDGFLQPGIYTVGADMAMVFASADGATMQYTLDLHLETVRSVPEDGSVFVLFVVAAAGGIIASRSDKRVRNVRQPSLWISNDHSSK